VNSLSTLFAPIGTAAATFFWQAATKVAANKVVLSKGIEMNRQISKHTNKFLLCAFTGIAVLAFGFTSDSASANEYRHINRLAVKIRNQTRTLLRETEHYRYTANYRHLVGDAAALRQLAEHTREVARNEGDLDHLAADVAEMDRTFHHLENLFDETELLAVHCKGSVKGHTAHVKRLLNSIEDCIHHIQDDIAELRSTVIIAPPIVVQRPVVFQRPVVVQRPVIVQRPIVDDGCPYSRSRRDQPIVTRVETYRVPADAIRRHDRTYGGYGGGEFSFSLGDGSSRRDFNF